MAEPAKITPADIMKMKELQETISAFRKTLAPKIKMIEDTLTALPILPEIMTMMEFEGREKWSCNVKSGEIPLEVTFKVKKTSA